MNPIKDSFFTLHIYNCMWNRDLIVRWIKCELSMRYKKALKEEEAKRVVGIMDGLAFNQVAGVVKSLES